jgi:enoyl-CoA hydratase
MTYSNLITDIRNGIGYITINRPDKLNALNKSTIDELSHAMQAMDNDKSAGVIILTGSGEKAFVAGADISEFASFSVEEGKNLSRQGHEKLFNVAEKLGTPVIAAVNGFALGGGLELAMSCHIRVASDNARMGLPEVSLGVIPGYGGTQRLARLVGKGRALELICTAGMIKADEAWRMGLVNHLVPQPDLMAKCEEIAMAILKNSPMAIASAIRAVNAGYQPATDGMMVEIDEFGRCFGTEEFREGTGAFLEKRKPSFR